MTANAGNLYFVPHRQPVWREAVLWCACGLFVLGAHAGMAAWIMRTIPPAPTDDAPPTAIMIELAPEIVAPEIVEESIALDPAVSESAAVEPIEPNEMVEPVTEAAVAAEHEPEEEPFPEELSAVDPVEVPEKPAAPLEEIDPVEEMITMQLDRVEVPLPQRRPEPIQAQPVRTKPEVRKEPVRKPEARRSLPSRSAEMPNAQVRKARVAAATQTNKGAGSSVSPARWQSRLMAHLERRKRYPTMSKQLREEGIAYVRFSIDDGGNVLSVRLSRSTGFPALDDEVVAMVRRASPVPAPPPGVNKSITVPVEFSVR